MKSGTISARSRSQRRTDTLAKLRSDVDLWVASADETGAAYLVPLSYYWDDTTLTIATPRASRTARNLIRADWARVALGTTRDVVIIEGVDPARHRLGARESARPGNRIRPENPRRGVYLRITPDTIQAWREANELAGRQLMRRGEWLD